MMYSKKPGVDEGTIALVALALIAKSKWEKADARLSERVLALTVAHLDEAEAEVLAEIARRAAEQGPPA